jgi:hypothetical protein
MPCSLAVGYHRFGRTWYLRLQGRLTFLHGVMSHKTTAGGSQENSMSTLHSDVANLQGSEFWDSTKRLAYQRNFCENCPTPKTSDTFSTPAFRTTRSIPCNATPSGLVRERPNLQTPNLWARRGDWQGLVPSHVFASSRTDIRTDSSCGSSLYCHKAHSRARL